MKFINIKKRKHLREVNDENNNNNDNEDNSSNNEILLNLVQTKEFEKVTEPFPLGSDGLRQEGILIGLSSSSSS